MEKTIFELGQELRNCTNEKIRLEKVLLIESTIFKRTIELEQRISELKDDINSFYHPVQK